MEQGFPRAHCIQSTPDFDNYCILVYVCRFYCLAIPIAATLIRIAACKASKAASKALKSSGKQLSCRQLFSSSLIFFWIIKKNKKDLFKILPYSSHISPVCPQVSVPGRLTEKVLTASSYRLKPVHLLQIFRSGRHWIWLDFCHFPREI